MSGLGRNDVCGCGSGLKVKRCCGQSRGPSPERAARDRLRSLARLATSLLCDHDVVELADHFDEAVLTPALHPTLRLQIPADATVEVQWLREAIAGGDDRDDELVDYATGAVDGPQVRLALAEEALRLVDEDALDPCLLAVILLDLDMEHSAIVAASLIAALSAELRSAPTTDRLRSAS